jgi:hypothetical protein
VTFDVAEAVVYVGFFRGVLPVSTSVVWLKPLSKFVLEVSPLVSALLIGAYLVSGAHEGRRPPATAAAIPQPDSAMLSGEAVTAMIMQAHAAVAAENREQATRAEARPAEVVQTAAAVDSPVKPAAKIAHAKAKPATPAAKVADATPPSVTPPPPAAVPPKHPGILRRTWGAVSGWSGAVAHAAKIDYAADVVAETPSAVARAGRKTWRAFTSILPDDPRR